MLICKIVDAKSLPYLIPREGSMVVFNCNTSSTDDVRWLLPQGTSMANSTASFSSGQQLYDMHNVNQLIIRSVQLDMDGEYVCTVNNKIIEIFYIPYIIANVNYTDSIILSLLVSVFFGVACLTVLLFSRHCCTRHTKHFSLVAPESSEIFDCSKSTLMNISSIN
uniref:Ig-like domain-containing protein n=1 Tax=Syphacia muris TaxID=451379 RepID=A0A0N5AHG1_9BILA